jgi:hypothetical protein
MSMMLDEAIIDAEALREAAIKSAESTILEKYSTDIKDAVESLLSEQEDPMAMEEPMPMDPMMGDPGALDEDSAEEVPDVPPAEGLCPCPDIDTASAAVPVGLSNVAQPLSEDLEIDFEALEQELMAEDNNLEVEITSNLIEEVLTEDDDQEIDILDLEELVEKLEVDIDPQKSGWIERPIADIQLAVDQAEASEDAEDFRYSKDNNLVSPTLQVSTKISQELEEAVGLLGDENKILNENIVSLEFKNEEVIKVVTTLKNKLQEVNLSNARLLYTNRILSSPSLNERQKSKIVESLSNANSVQEAKVIFETLQSTVGVSSQQKRPETLSEVVSRNNSSLRLPRQDAQEAENTGHFNRMKKLAGIK